MGINSPQSGGEEDHNQLRRCTPTKIRVPQGGPDWTAKAARGDRPASARATRLDLPEQDYKPLNTLTGLPKRLPDASADVFDAFRARSFDARRQPLTLPDISMDVRDRAAAEGPSTLRDLSFSDGFSKYRRLTSADRPLRYPTGTPISGQSCPARGDSTKRSSARSGKNLEETSDDDIFAGSLTRERKSGAVDKLLFPEVGHSKGKNLVVESLQIGEFVRISDRSMDHGMSIAFRDDATTLVLSAPSGSSASQICIPRDLIGEAYFYVGGSPAYIDVKLCSLPLDLQRLLPDQRTTCDALLLRITLESKDFSALALAQMLRNGFSNRAKQLSYSSEYRPDFTFDPAWHYPRSEMRRARTTRSNAGKIIASKADSDEDDGVSVLSSSGVSRSTNPELEARPKLLFTFPPEGDDSVSINSNDVRRLPEGYYLNDSIIDFDLRRMLAEASEKVRAQVHIFSSFFFRKLRTDGRAPNTRVNVFDKRYLFIPINEHLHWYLGLVYNPSALLSSSTSGTPSSGSQEIASGSSQVDETAGSMDGTFVIIFDSLGSKYRRAAVEKLIALVLSEAKSKMSLDCNKKDITVMYPRLPLQKNLTDCGCFLLEYVDRFLRDPEVAMLKIIKRQDMSRWFEHDDATLRRWRIKSLFEELEAKFKESHPEGQVACHPANSSDIEEIHPLPIDPS